MVIPLCVPWQLSLKRSQETLGSYIELLEVRQLDMMDGRVRQKHATNNSMIDDAHMIFSV